MKPRVWSNGGNRIRQPVPPPDPLPDPDGALDGWMEATRIVPVSAATWDNDPQFRSPARFTTDVNWMWIAKGSGEVIVGEEEQSLPVRPGSLVLLPPGMRHIEFFPGHRRWACESIHFRAWLYGRLDAVGLLGFPVCLWEAPGGEIERISRSLSRHYDAAPPAWRVAMTALILEGLVHLVHHFGSSFDDSPLRDGGKDMVRLLPALDIIEERFADPSLQIGELAAAIHLSEVRFRCLFRNALGLTPVRFIQQRRVEAAARKLRATDRPIQSIAGECGFRDAPFFYRIFKRWTGSTPGDYRDRVEP